MGVPPVSGPPAPSSVNFPTSARNRRQSATFAVNLALSLYVACAYQSADITFAAAVASLRLMLGIPLAAKSITVAKRKEPECGSRTIWRIRWQRQLKHLFGC